MTTSTDALRDRVTRAFPGLALPEIPRRFLLVEYTDDSDDGSPEIFAWGLEVGAFAVVFQPGGLLARVSSAERALSMFRRSCDDMIWLDEPPGA